MNDKVDIEIARRRLTVEIEGLTELEILTLAKTVNDKIQDISANNKNSPDTSKIAILAALEFAADLARVNGVHETARRVVERKIEEMTLSLKTTLANAGK